MAIAYCIGCGCDDFNACYDEMRDCGCHWIRVDRETGEGVCSECQEHAEAWDRGDRTRRAMTQDEIELEAIPGRIVNSAAEPPAHNTPCRHHWPYLQPEMSDCCNWCGMSFARHIHTECP